ncbi:MAG: metalloregulator ArsR/SmtB family transcription factor [Candidatus Altiarchaeales archaeon]|nr:metalloregulator ArsR/SmtB family transcription factor [Candidatus Altiarchaeales archaeon]MBD3416717.1 metalloregulator ArsR/SmtB family transcription factor [Candidatus Altiarchaeales archaeon]
MMSDKITLDRETFKVLAADTRIEILKKLSLHKLTLSDIAEQMGMRPSTIKEHLDRLVEAGLIEAEDRGTKWKYYHLTPKGKGIVSPNETKVWILLGTSLLALAGSAMSIFTKLTYGNMLKSVPAPADEMAMGGPGMIQAAKTVVYNETVSPLLEGAGEGSRMMKYSAPSNLPDDSVNATFDSVQEAAGTASNALDSITETTTTVASTIVDRVSESVSTTLAPMLYHQPDSAGVQSIPFPTVEVVVLIASVLAVGFCTGYLLKKRIKLK